MRNATNYTQIKVSVTPEIAAAFKAACKADKVSMAGVLSEFMANRADARAEGRAARNPLASRGGRRLLLDGLIRQLEQIREAEEAYRDAIPENLSESIRHENADQSVSAMEEAIDMLKDAY